MTIKIDGIGKLKNVNFTLGDITVIVGENNSGKSTIGKAVATFINALNQASDNYFLDIKENIITKIKNGFNSYFQFCLDSALEKDNPLEFVKYYQKLLKSKNFNELAKALDEYLDYFSKRETNESLRNEFIKFFDKTIQYKANNIDDCVSSLRNLITDCKNNIEKITFDKYQNSFVKQSLDETFNDQIFPINSKIVNASIALDEVKVNLTEDEALVDYKKSIPFNRAFFIGDANILDELSAYKDHLKIERTISNDKNWRYDLKSVLLDAILSENNSIIDDVIGKDSFKAIKEIKTSKFDDEETIYKNGRYLLNKSKLDVRNLATGSKLSLILKELVKKHFVDEKTLIVLDEPESHLHPEWQEIIAELIVVIAKELKAKIVVTTHSINLLMAIIMYSKKYQKYVSSKYYMITNVDEYFTTLKDYTNDTSMLIGNLGRPFVELNQSFDEVFDDKNK